MTVTKLKSKERKNKAKAANRINRIKQLSRKPVIKKLETNQVTDQSAKISEEEE